MSTPRLPLDLKQLKVYPLAQRHSLSRIEEILINPDSTPAPCSEPIQTRIAECASAIRAARKRGASGMFLYGAHLVKNGGASIINRLMENGWLTHLVTNGAGSIHDGEFAFQVLSSERVEEKVATGNLGT